MITQVMVTLKTVDEERAYAFVLLFRPIEKVKKELQLFMLRLRLHASLLRKQQTQ
jgi:hypothetical protein